MPNKIELAVEVLHQAQQALAEMTTDERMMVGERLAAALRSTDALQKCSFLHEKGFQQCEIVAGALQITVKASFTPRFESRLSEADIPF